MAGDWRRLESWRRDETYLDLALMSHGAIEGGDGPPIQRKGNTGGWRAAAQALGDQVAGRRDQGSGRLSAVEVRLVLAPGGEEGSGAKRSLEWR